MLQQAVFTAKITKKLLKPDEVFKSLSSEMSNSLSNESLWLLIKKTIRPRSS